MFIYFLDKVISTMEKRNNWINSNIKGIETQRTKIETEQRYGVKLK